VTVKKLISIYNLQEAKSMSYYGGPTRWDGYDESKWNSDEAEAKFGRLVRSYDFVWLQGGRGRKAITLSTTVDDVPPYLPEDGQTLFEWLMFIDDVALGQDLRMAIQDGSWEDVVKVANEVARDGGLSLPPPRGLAS